MQAPYVLCFDAAQYARGRKGADGTSVILTALLKRRLARRTEHSLLVASTLTKDDIAVLRPHITAATPEVPSVVETVRRLATDGITTTVVLHLTPAGSSGGVTTTVKHFLAIASLDLKALVQAVAGLGFRSEFDNPYHGSSRSTAAVWTDGLGLQASRAASCVVADRAPRRVSCVCVLCSHSDYSDLSASLTAQSYQPPDWRYSDIVAALAAASSSPERKIVLDFYKKKSAPVFTLDAIMTMHGEMHNVGTGTQGLFKELGKLYVKISPAIFKRWLAHVSSCCKWPIEM